MHILAIILGEPMRDRCVPESSLVFGLPSRAHKTDIIKSLEGDEAFKTYSTLPEPRLSGTWSYMVCGMILALGTTGKPMFIEGFSGDAEIMAQNGIAYEQRRAEPRTRARAGYDYDEDDVLDGTPEFME